MIRTGKLRLPPSRSEPLSWWQRNATSVVGHGGGDCVGGVAGEVVAGAGVAAGGAGVGVADGVLHVAQRDAFVEGGGDEGGAHGVRADAFGVGDAGVAGEAADEAPGGDPVEGGAGGGGEDGSVGALADQRVEGNQDGGGERGGGAFVAFAPVAQYPVAVGDGQVVDAGGGGLADPQSVGEQQGDQGVGAGAVGAGGGAELAAFGGAEPGGGVVVVGAGAFDVGEGGAGDGVLAGGVAVEAVQRRGAAGDAGRGQPAAAAGITGFGEQPEVGVGVVDAGGERIEVEAGAERQPGGQVGGVGVAGLGRALREQEPPHQVVEGAEPLRLDRRPVGRSELASGGGGQQVGHGPRR